MSASRPVSPRRCVRPLVLALVVGLLCTLAAGAATAQAPDDDAPVVDVLPVRGYLDPPVAGAMIDLLADAEARGADLVVLQVDGPGGISADVAGLVDAITSAEVPVAVFVSPQQGLHAHAGGLYGLLWAVAPIRAMSTNASIGPISPANLADAPGTTGERDLVEQALGAAGTDLLDAEVDAADLEATDVDVVVATNVAALLAELDGREVAMGGGTTTLDIPRDQLEVRLHSLGLLRRLLHAAAAPALIYLLLVLGLGMLAFEAFQPGFGVAGFAGLVLLPFAAFGLTVLPVTWWALALVLAGFALYAVDAALAGLGPVTALATASFGVGSWSLFGTDVLRVPPALVVATTLVALVFFVVVLTVILRAQAGPEGVELDDLVGRHGIVRSILNPEGHVYIDDALWRARVSDDRRMKVGAPVTVTSVDGAVLVVEPFDAASVSTPVDDGATTP